MTSPTDPRVVPQAPAPTPPVTPEVVATAKKLVRVRSFTKSAFEKVGVPSIIGAATGLLVANRVIRSSQNNEELDDVTTTVNDE